MKRIIILIFLAGLGVLLVGCATTKDVMPGEDGINRVSIKARDDEGGRSKAIKEANNYCKKKNKEAVFIGDKTKYTGSMDEDDRNTIKNASNAAMIVGGMTQPGVFNPLTGTGVVGNTMVNGKDYQTDVKFKCQ